MGTKSLKTVYYTTGLLKLQVIDHMIHSVIYISQDTHNQGDPIKLSNGSGRSGPPSNDRENIGSMTTSGAVHFLRHLFSVCTIMGY